MSKLDDLITGIEQREGGSKLTDIPGDTGGRTIYGISEKANPDLWKSGPPTEAQARQRYMDRYVKGPGFDKILDPALQVQLVDFGVNSGPSVAISKLQEVLGLSVDGILGPATLASANAAPPVVVNNKLAIKRILMIGSIVTKNSSQAQFALGWLNRAVEFIIL